MSKLYGHLLNFYFLSWHCVVHLLSLLVYLDDCKIFYTLSLVLFGYYKVRDVLFN